MSEAADAADETDGSVITTGYYRAKNLGGYNGQDYVVVKGRATADASATSTTMLTSPGSILYINLSSTPTEMQMKVNGETKTVNGYEILNLRSQGVDVMNGAEMSSDELATNFPLDFTELLGGDFSDVYNGYNGYVGFGRYLLSVFSTTAQSLIESYAQKKITNFDATTFESLMSDFTTNYLPQLKFQVYLIPVDGATNTFYVRSMVPSMKPISNFYNNNKEQADAVLIPAVRKYLEDYNYVFTNAGINFTGEKFTQADQDVITSWYNADGGNMDYLSLCEKDADGNLVTDADGNYTLSYNTILSNDQYIFDYLKLQAYHILGTERFNGYFNIIHYNTPYYLIQGNSRATSTSGERVFEASTELGFANDGSKTAYNRSDLDNAGDNAKWVLEAVDATNYFAVKPLNHAARNGKYYTTTYVDFPFKASGSGITGIYTLDTESGVLTTEDGTAQYVLCNKLEDGATVPAATPVIIETSTSLVSSDIALVPQVSDERATQNSLIQGTFFGGKHNVTSIEAPSNNDTKEMIKYYLKLFKDGSIQAKYNVTTDGKDLYLFGYNKADSRNPYGFYIYSKNSDAEDASTNNIPANRPFLTITPDASAKTSIYLVVNGGTTGVQELFAGEQVEEDAPRYNLQGQRVDANYKGIVIVNGKKLIQK